MYAERLHRSGLRSTAPRRAVLRALDGGGHLHAAAVYDLVREELPGTSLQAVYIVLTALVDSGLARKVELASGSALFEARVGDNHHHLLCTSCGKVEDVPCVTGEAPCLTPEDTAGFTLNLAQVTFHGLCTDCQKTAAA